MRSHLTFAASCESLIALGINNLIGYNGGNEKRKPHYDLATVKIAVQQRGADAFTATALVGAQAMGLDSALAIRLVCAMTRADFYKSMTTHAASQVWQDVYHPVVPNGKVAYVKITLRAEGSIVIQFKEK